HDPPQVRDRAEVRDRRQPGGLHLQHPCRAESVAERRGRVGDVEPTRDLHDPRRSPLGSRFMQMSAPPGSFSVRYEATVDIAHHFESPARIEETPIARLPPEALAFIYPSRYCQSDRLRRFATREFGHLRPGYWRVQAIRDWVGTRTAFVPGFTDSSTS